MLSLLLTIQLDFINFTAEILDLLVPQEYYRIEHEIFNLYF